MNELTPQEALRLFTEKRFSSCYLIFGEETYFVDQVLRGLRTLNATEEEWNYDDRDGRTISPKEVVLLAKQCLLTATRRILVLRNADKISDPQEHLLTYLQSPSPTTVMVLIAVKPDMRLKFFSTLKPYATRIHCRPLYDNEIPRFIRETAKQQNLRLTDEQIGYIQESAGKDLYSIHRELEKIALLPPLSPHMPLDPLDAAMPAPSRAHSVFELINAVEVRDMRQGLAHLSALLSEGEPPLIILAMLIRHFRIMIRAKEQLQTQTESEVRKTLSFPPSRVGPFFQSLRLWTAEELRAVFDSFREADDRLKGSATAASIILEQLVMRLCQPLRVL